MTGVRKSLKWTLPDATVDAFSLKSCQVLETNPPDYVEKISRYLESSVGQSREEEVSKEASAAESDSGDSLFITQKPVPEAVRQQRRRHFSLRLDPASPRGLEESEDSDSSSSASYGESKTAKRSRRKKCRLPEFSFPFLKGRRCKPGSTLLSVEQNTALHHYVMGGFFKCVRELWQNYQRDDLLSSLPTVDLRGGHISPLSEEEEERAENEDIKVVERKRLVAPSKTKRSQPWYTPDKKDGEGKHQCRRASNARREMSQTRQRKILHEIPAKVSKSGVTALSSDTDGSECGDSSDRALTERKTSAKQVTSEGSVVAQTETSKTNRHLTRGHKKMLFQEKESEEEPCEDSDATICEALEQRSSRESTLTGREALNVTEPQADVFHTDNLSQTEQEEDEPESQSLLQSLSDLISDTNNDKVCNERVKKKKKKKTRGDHESTEEEKGHSQEEPEGLHATASLNVGAGETPSLSEDNPAEPLASQTSDELQLNEDNLSHDVVTLRQEERHSPDSKLMKKKRKKKKAAAETVVQEEDGSSPSDVRLEHESLFCFNVVNVDKEKKKKRKGRVEGDEGVEHLEPSDISEAVNDDAETHRKKKKRKKEKMIVNMEEYKEGEALNMTSEGQFKERGDCLGNTGASQETESSHERKKKKPKKKQLLASHIDAEVGAENYVDVSSSNDATLGGSTGHALKKKKKKKKRRESISEEGDVSCNLDENKKVNKAENSQKTEAGPHDQDAELVSKKKKKKESEKFSRNVSEDAVTQSDDSVSVQKKEKKRTSSFLVADAEEKDAQTHKEQSSLCSKPVAVPVWGAEKPGVSSVDFETVSAEIPGNLDDGVRKKKRKRKRSVVQESVEKDFEEPDKTCQSSLPEITDIGVKRKKTRKRSERESVTPMERLESASEAGDPPTDAAVALKKKKKKKKKCKDEPGHAAQENPPAATDNTASGGTTLKTCSSVSHKRKDKQSHCLLNLAGSASASSATLGSPALKTMGDKNNKKKVKRTDDVLVERKLSTESAEMETHRPKKERKKPTSVLSFTSCSPVLSRSELSSSDCISKNKQKKARKRLYNTSEDFLSDC